MDPEFQFLLMRASAWDMYASAALSMSLHPGTTRHEAHKDMTAAKVAAIADELLAIRDDRFALHKENDTNEADPRH